MELFFVFFNSLAFFVYGVLCVCTGHMLEEFKRYGLIKYRRLTGILEVCGAIGTILGYFFNSYLYLFSTVGLAVLMLLGLFTRMRVRDTFLELMPAFALFVLNTYLAFLALKSLGF